MDKSTQMLENVVRCKYFEAGIHIKNLIENSYQDGLDRTTQTLDHVVVVHILIWDKKKSQIDEYSDKSTLNSRQFLPCRVQPHRMQANVGCTTERAINLGGRVFVNPTTTPRPHSIVQKRTSCKLEAHISRVIYMNDSFNVSGAPERVPFYDRGEPAVSYKWTG